MKRVWNSAQRPISATHAARLCKDHAAIKLNLSVERIADLMGVTHDLLYKWLGNGRMPLILIPAFELACGCSYLSEWLATSAGKLVINMPKGKKPTTADLMAINTTWANALALLTNFYSDPSQADTEATLAALRTHMEQVAYHHQNVGSYTTPELEFGS